MWVYSILGVQGEQDGGQQRIAIAYFKTNKWAICSTKNTTSGKKKNSFSVTENSYNKKFGPNCFLAFLTVKIN